jgi:hypothetical protein
MRVETKKMSANQVDLNKVYEKFKSFKIIEISKLSKKSKQD